MIIKHTVKQNYNKIIKEKKTEINWTEEKEQTSKHNPVKKTAIQKKTPETPKKVSLW